MAAPPQQGGYRSHFGWWFGGYSAGASTPPVPQDSGGHFGEEDYRRYRKYLERLAGIREESEITDEVSEAIEAVSVLPIATPNLEAITSTPSIDFEKIASEVSLINEYLDRMLLISLNIQRQRADDELAILLLV